MDRDDFIIAVYCLVCEHYKAVCATLPHRLRRGGFAPQLSDEEVITIEVCGEYFKMKNDKDIFAYFHSPHPRRRGGFAPQLSNEEVIPIEVCGEYFKMNNDKDIFAYSHSHYRHFF